MKKGITFTMTIHTKTKTHFPLGWKHFIVTIPENDEQTIKDLAKIAFLRICQHENLNEKIDMPVLTEYEYYGQQNIEIIDFCK